jgi:hypothetical protein
MQYLTAEDVTGAHFALVKVHEFCTIDAFPVLSKSSDRMWS